MIFDPYPCSDDREVGGGASHHASDGRNDVKVARDQCRHRVAWQPEKQLAAATTRKCSERCWFPETVDGLSLIHISEPTRPP